MIKSAICTTFKDELYLPYLEEWIKYHHGLGFTSIYVYTNVNVEKFIHYDNVIVKPFAYDDNDEYEASQTRAIEDCFDSIKSDYDFLLPLDLDEFLNVRAAMTLDEFLSQYSDFYAIYLRWCIFGSSGMERVMNGNYSLINRFLYCSGYLEGSGKTIVNVKKIQTIKGVQDGKYTGYCGHSCNEKLHLTHYEVTKAVRDLSKYDEKEMAKVMQIAYINHYITRSREELKKRLENSYKMSGFYKVEFDKIGYENGINEYIKKYDNPCHSRKLEPSVFLKYLKMN